jgi:hypothetical protein
MNVIGKWMKIKTSILRLLFTVIFSFGFVYALEISGVSQFFLGVWLICCMRIAEPLFFVVFPSRQRYIIWYQNFDGDNGFYLANINPEKYPVKTTIKKNSYRFKHRCEAYAFIKEMRKVSGPSNHLPMVQEFYQ